MYSGIGFFAVNGGIGVLNVVLRTLSAILDFLEWERICGVLLLKKCIAHIPLVVQHVVDAEGVPCCCSVASWNAFLIQLVCDSLLPIALKVHGEDPTDDGRFRFVDDQVTVDKVEAVCRSTAVEVAGLHPLLITPTHIPRYRLALLLGGHTGECYDHLTIQFVGIDALFLEVDADADVFEKADRCQKLLGVSGESGH